MVPIHYFPIVHNALCLPIPKRSAYSQEHSATIVYAKFGGQTECIMGNWKIENRLVVPLTSSMWDLHCTRPCPLLGTSSLAFGFLLRCTSWSVYACAKLFISRLRSILKSLSSILYLQRVLSSNCSS